MQRSSRLDSISKVVFMGCYPHKFIIEYSPKWVWTMVVVKLKRWMNGWNIDLKWYSCGLHWAGPEAGLLFVVSSDKDWRRKAGGGCVRVALKDGAERIIFKSLTAIQWLVNGGWGNSPDQLIDLKAGKYEQRVVAFGHTVKRKLKPTWLAFIG